MGADCYVPSPWPCF